MKTLRGSPLFIARGLGDLEAAASWPEHDLDADLQAGQHIDEGVGAEQVNPSPEQIARAGLGHAEDLARFGLREASGGPASGAVSSSPI